MEDQYSKELRCPICFEIPQWEIYQCTNGHTICSKCSMKLLECPQCRATFQSGKVRNRAMESLLDKMKFECSYKSLGCTSTILRKEISSHEEGCSFNQNNIKLCEYLEFPCSFLTNVKNFPVALAHFRRDHGFIICHSHAIDIRLEDFLSIDRSQRSRWTPVIMDLDSKFGVQLLVNCLYNRQEQTITMEYIQLNEESDSPRRGDLRAEFIIKTVDPSKNMDLIWSTPPAHITKANVLYKPPIQFKMEQLSSYVEDDALIVRCSITKRSTEEETTEGHQQVDSVCAFNIPSCSPEEPTTMNPTAVRAALQSRINAAANNVKSPASQQHFRQKPEGSGSKLKWPPEVKRQVQP